MKTPTSSKKKPYKRKVKLVDGTIIHTNDNYKSNIQKGLTYKHDIKHVGFSTETGKGDSEWEVTDDLDSSEFPPPSTHPDFRKFWAENIDNITGRENFNPGHLGLFEALCRLRVELRALDSFIAKHGHTFRVVGAMGESRKTFPEVRERMGVLSQIAMYSKLLDLVPKKDKSRSKKRKDKGEWE